MVVIEVALVVAFLAAAWHVWNDRQRPPIPSSAALSSTAGAPSTSRRPPLPSRSPRSMPSPPAGASPLPAPGQGPVPGLSNDPAFAQQQMQRIGSDQSRLEALEWQAIDSVVGWVRRYVDQVVVPALETAGHGA
jgi:hypothetical protein